MMVGVEEQQLIVLFRAGRIVGLQLSFFPQELQYVHLCEDSAAPLAGFCHS